MFESLCTGKLIFAVENYNHQKNIISFFEKKKAIIKINKNKIGKEINKHLEFLEKNINPYLIIQKKGLKFIDGKGTKRSFVLIKNLLKQK